MPGTLTKAQLDYFSEQTERAVRKALRRYVRGAVIGFLVLAVGLGIALHANATTSNHARQAVVNSGRAVTVAGCNRDYRATQRFRGLLTRAQATTAVQHKQHKITDQQFADAQNFYRTELAKLPLPDCRKVEVILTDNPDAPIVIPPALHPPDRT